MKSIANSFRAAATVALLLSAVPAAAQAPPLETLDLEQLMEIEVVVAGSKREQQTRDVPSFVTVVTAAEIKAHGYRTLGDVLQTLASFYVSNDRNYSFLGVRGFARPGDYNSRVLLLLNGLRTNDNIYDTAAIGQDFLLDVDLVERIEVIRGPSAALYGSNAFFAVINVVTRRGASLQGGEAAASVASFGTLGGRATYGRALASGLDLLVSASYSDSEGQRLYFPEFDDPSTNDGIAENADGETFHKLLATASKGPFSFQATTVSREKFVPTGSFGTVFNDPRTNTVDGSTMASLSYNRAFSGGSSITGRVDGGRWRYEGTYPYDPVLPPSGDEAIGEWWGVEVHGARRFSRHFLTVGAEYRDNYRQDQQTYEREPLFFYTDVKNASRRWGAFAQDEVKLAEPLTLYAGVRYDRYESFGSMISPRAGLIYSTGSATTVKLLAGRAFRAPNEFELYYESTQYRPSPNLQPERIQTLELVAQRRIGPAIQLTAAAFRNQLNELVTQVANDVNELTFVNADEIESKGLEVGAQYNHGHGPTARITYSMQRTEERATGIELTNSPRHMAKLQLVVPFAGRLSAALDAVYLSRLRTLGGNTAASHTVSNFSLFAPRLFGRLDVSATVYNLLDAAYVLPGSEEHIQDVIAQDGRSFRVKTTLRF